MPPSKSDSDVSLKEYVSVQFQQLREDLQLLRDAIAKLTTAMVLRSEFDDVKTRLSKMEDSGGNREIRITKIEDLKEDIANIRDRVISMEQTIIILKWTTRILAAVSIPLIIETLKNLIW